MNAGTLTSNPQENTVHTWLLPIHVDNKDATATLDSNLIYYVLEISHTKLPH